MLDQLQGSKALPLLGSRYSPFSCPFHSLEAASIAKTKSLPDGSRPCRWLPVCTQAPPRHWRKIRRKAAFIPTDIAKPLADSSFASA